MTAEAWICAQELYISILQHFFLFLIGDQFTNIGDIFITRLMRRQFVNPYVVSTNQLLTLTVSAVSRNVPANLSTCIMGRYRGVRHNSKIVCWYTMKVYYYLTFMNQVDELVSSLVSYCVQPSYFTSFFWENLIILRTKKLDWKMFIKT